MAPELPPRRFAPMPVETSKKSNRDVGAGDKEGTSKAPRKFNIQPVESSSKSSKGKAMQEPAQSEKPARKFAIQPVETSSKSSRKQQEEIETKPRSRFAPQPVEMSTSSSRRRKASPPRDDDPPSPKSVKVPEPEAKPARRKFAPQLIDTSSRSRKNSDSEAAPPSGYKTDAIPSHVMSPHATFELPSAAEFHKPSHRIPLPHERRRERSLSHSSKRSHSFRCPDLETIESSESEPSQASSLSSTSSDADSPLTSSDIPVSEMYKHATRIRESVDESFSRYMLELEAKRAELKLQEQALAAFANSDFHEPVEHYVDESGSEDVEIDDRPATWDGHDEDDEMDSRPMRKGTNKVNWELQEMQKHHESLEQDRTGTKSAAKRMESTPSPWWNPGGTDFAATKQQDPELTRQIDRARPPMLGDDIKFPRSASPEPARFDVTQGSQALKSQMCYLTEQSGGSTTNLTSPDGLWGKSSAQNSARSSQSQGLWGGFCVESEEQKKATLAPPTGPTGLMTPAVEKRNPFDYGKLVVNISRPPTPPTPTRSVDNGGMSRIDSMLHSERELDLLMEREFPDTFITQVYNYLSLGYPSLARPFDEELSKISTVSMADLRHDDQIAKDMPKGYIRLGDDFEGRGDGSSQDLAEGGCARWRALKSYVREWARQEKGMVPVDDMGGNWGTGPRRGSWAW